MKHYTKVVPAQAFPLCSRRKDGESWLCISLCGHKVLLNGSAQEKGIFSGLIFGFPFESVCDCISIMQANIVDFSQWHCAFMAQDENDYDLLNACPLVWAFSMQRIFSLTNKDRTEEAKEALRAVRAIVFGVSSILFLTCLVGTWAAKYAPAPLVPASLSLHPDSAPLSGHLLIQCACL